MTVSVGPAGVELSNSLMTATGARLCWPGLWFCLKTKQKFLWVEYVMASNKTKKKKNMEAAYHVMQF